MKKFILMFILAITFLSCGENISELDNQREKLKGVYQLSNKAEDAVKLAEFYNLKYTANKEQIEIGLKEISEFKALFPDELKFRILEGNLYTIYGGAFAKKMDLENAMRNMSKGFTYMDEAISLYPDNLYFRIYRGINSVNVPKMFNRLQYALIDFPKIINSEDVSDEILLLAYQNYAKALKINKDKAKYKEIVTQLKVRFPG